MYIRSTSVSIFELSRIPLFSNFTEWQLKPVQRSLRIIYLSEGDRLFDQGDVVRKFYFVRTGQIKQSRVSIEGNERVVDIVQAGQVFAENLLSMENPVYPFSAEALTNAELLTFDAQIFIEVLGKSVDGCFKLMSSMAMNIQHYMEQLDYLTMQNSGFRLVNYLLKQVPGNYQDNGPYTFHLVAPKAVIASCLSIQPETLSRHLATLRARELIEVRGKMITINDISQLREMVA